MDGVQNFAEGEGSDPGTAEPDERTAEVQRLQEEVRMLQEAVGKIGVEVQWVAQGGESRAQSLQVAMEDVWGEVRGLQKSAQELAEIAEGLRSTIEGSELSEGATVLVHGLVSRGRSEFSDGAAG